MNSRLRPLAQILLLAAGIGLVIASVIWDKDVLFFSGIPLLVFAFAWFVPAPAGIVGIVFSLYQVIRYHLYGGLLPSTPPPGQSWQPVFSPYIPQGLYYLLYGSVILGCAINLYLGIRKLRLVPKTISNRNKSLHLVARVTTGISLLASITFFLFDEASVAFVFNVWAIIAFAIAWFWPDAGGALMVIVGGWPLYDLLTRGFSTERVLIYSILFSVFMVGGFINLFLGLRERSSTLTNNHNERIKPHPISIPTQTPPL